MRASSGAQRTVAVLGASKHRHKYGNKSVRAHAAAGWTVFPVSFSGGDIEGLHAAERLGDLSSPVHRISVYLPPPVTLELLPEIAQANASEVWFNPGAADASVLARATELGIPYIDGCSIVDLGLSPADFP